MGINLKMRIEEYVPTGLTLMASFSRDRPELKFRFKEFTDEYEKAFAHQVDKIRLLEQNIDLDEEQKKAKQVIRITAEMLNSDLNFLAFYFKRAGLDANMVSKARKELLKRHFDEAFKKLTDLSGYIKDHAVILEKKGMEYDYPDKLIQEINALKHRHIDFIESIKDKKEAYWGHREDYKKLCGFITTVATAGKAMYDGLEKKDDYTVTKILGKMRADVGGVSV